MKKLLFAALAALLAVPAFAMDVAVIMGNNRDVSRNRMADAAREMVVRGVLETLGCNYEFMTQDDWAARGAGNGNFAPYHARDNLHVALRSGSRCTSPDCVRQRQYGLVIHLNYIANNVGFRTPGFTYVDSALTSGTALNGFGVGADMWPIVPHIFLGPTRTVGGSIFSNGGACSTAVVGSATATQNFNYKIGLRRVGGRAWLTGDYFYFRDLTNGITLDRTTPGIERPIIVAGTNAIGSYYATHAAGGTTGIAAWPDSMANPGPNDTKADSVILWTREVSGWLPLNSHGGEAGLGVDSTGRLYSSKKPLIFALTSWPKNGISQTDVSIVAMAVAIADSAMSGKIIGQKPGWRPVPVSVLVSGAFTRSASNVSSNQWNSHGTQLSDINDSTYVKAGIDSLKSLMDGAPVTVSVNIDSVASYPYEKNWWSSISSAKFFPEVRTGTVNTGSDAAGSAGRYTFPDLFGRNRSRLLLSAVRRSGYSDSSFADPDLAGSGAGQCVDGSGNVDTTMSCGLYWTRLRLDSIPEFRGRLSATAMAPFADFFGTNYTKASLPDKDDWVLACNRSGVVTLIKDVMSPTTMPGYSLGWGNEPPAGGTAFAQVSSGVGAFDARSGIQRGPYGTAVKWATTRMVDEDNTTVNANHDFANEFLTGFFTGYWYWTGTAYYQHTFKTPLNVFMVRPGDLGFRASATANPTRWGFYHLKSVVNQLRTINDLAGREVIRFVYPEDL